MASPVKSVSTGIGLGCLFLFGLPFLLGGIAIDCKLLLTGYDEVRSLFWKQVPCVIESAELKTIKGSKSNNYQAAATYRYQVDGKEFTSNRVSSVDMPDGVGGFQQQTFKELDEYRANGKPFRCFVNPSNPAEAVLYQQGNWAQILVLTIAALMFSGAGLLLVGSAVFGWIEAHRLAPLVTGPTQQPWESRADWAKGEIRHSDRNLSYGLLMGSVVAFVLAIPSCTASILELSMRQTWLALLAMIPMLIAMLLVWVGLRARARWQKFGDSVFQMAGVPGVLGGTLAGVVQIERSVVPADGFRVRLVCTETVTTGSSKNRQTRVDTLWEDQKIVVKDLKSDGVDGSNIPVLFVLPYQGYESEDDTRTDGDNRRVAWRLSIHADLPGIDYHAEFDVPVFQTDASDPNFKPDAELMEVVQLPSDSNLPMKHAGLTYESREGDGFVIGFPRFRGIGFSIAMLVVQVVFFGLITGACGYFWPVSWPYVAGVFGFLLFLSAVDMFLFYSEVDVTASTLKIQSGSFYLGAPIEIPATEVDLISINMAGSAGANSAHDILVRVKNGKTYVIGKRVMPKSVAEDIIRRIEKKLNKFGTPSDGQALS